MEEFSIPHSSATPPPVGEERIRIADIDDDLLQIAFKGEQMSVYLVVRIALFSYHYNI